MSSAAHLAFFAAAGIAMCSALFGVGLARLLWAEDLEQAYRLKIIWQGTEKALRGQIELHERQIAEYRRRLGEAK